MTDRQIVKCKNSLLLLQVQVLLIKIDNLFYLVNRSCDCELIMKAAGKNLTFTSKKKAAGGRGASLLLYSDS